MNLFKQLINKLYFQNQNSRNVDISSQPLGENTRGALCATKQSLTIKENYPYNILPSISKDTQSVNFSNIQNIGDYEKYTGMFCFQDSRYVVSLMKRNNINKKIKDKQVAKILSKNKTTEKKIFLLGVFNPTYVHITKYSQGKLIDDSEGFKSLNE